MYPDPAGRSAPLGATPSDGGVNFSVFSRSATGMELVLFDRVDDARPARVLPIDPVANRTYHYWHLFVPGVGPGQIYGFRAKGPMDPANGLRFDPGRSSSTRTAAPSPSRPATAAPRRAPRATTPRPR